MFIYNISCFSCFLSGHGYFPWGIVLGFLPLILCPPTSLLRHLQWMRRPWRAESASFRHFVTTFCALYGMGSRSFIAYRCYSSLLLSLVATERPASPTSTTLSHCWELTWRVPLQWLTVVIWFGSRAGSEGRDLRRWGWVATGVLRFCCGCPTVTLCDWPFVLREKMAAIQRHIICAYVIHCIVACWSKWPRLHRQGGPQPLR